MTAQHTPGPWRLCTGFVKWNNESDALIVDAGQFTSDIAWIPMRCEDLPNMEAAQLANARLIAAAPELLAACEALLAQHDESFAGREDMRAQYYASHPWREQAYNKARAAIATAEGSTP